MFVLTSQIQKYVCMIDFTLLSKNMKKINNIAKYAKKYFLPFSK